MSDKLSDRTSAGRRDFFKLLAVPALVAVAGGCTRRCETEPAPPPTSPVPAASSQEPDPDIAVVRAFVLPTPWMPNLVFEAAFVES
jgi:hypothetical protein